MPKYYVDTTSPSPANIAFVLRKHPCGGKDTMIAKCLFVEHAQLVCNALNAYVEPRKSNVKIVNRRHRRSKNELSEATVNYKQTIEQAIEAGWNYENGRLITPTGEQVSVMSKGLIPSPEVVNVIKNYNLGAYR